MCIKLADMNYKLFRATEVMLSVYILLLVDEEIIRFVEKNVAEIVTQKILKSTWLCVMRKKKTRQQRWAWSKRWRPIAYPTAQKQEWDRTREVRRPFKTRQNVLVTGHERWNIVTVLELDKIRYVDRGSDDGFVCCARVLVCGFESFDWSIAYAANGDVTGKTVLAGATSFWSWHVALSTVAE